MDPILLDFIQQVTSAVGSIDPNAIYVPRSALVQVDDQIKTIVKTFVDRYKDDPSVSPQTLTQIKNLSSFGRVTRFLDVSKIVSEASKVGVPAAEVAAVVEEALATEAPIASLPALQRLPAEVRDLQFTSSQASTITPSAFTSAPANVQMPSIPRPPGAPATASAFRSAAMGGSSSVASSVLPRMPSAVNLNAGVTGPVVQAESQAASVSPTVARSLTQTLMGAGSTALSGLAALGARFFGNRVVQGLVAAGLIGGAIYSANNPSETPAPPKSAPEIPIGPSAMQNLPSAAPTGPSADDLEYQKLLEQVGSMPESAGKYQAMGSLIVRRLTALESRRKELQTKLDSLDPTNLMQKDAYASTALLLRDTLTSIDKENDNWAKNEGLKRDQAKFDAANSPENLDLERRAKEAAIASANASAAASQSSAANSAMQRAVNEFQLAQAQDLAPTVKAKAEADLASTQLTLQIAEANLQKLQGEALQRDAVEALTKQYNEGKLTYDQYTEQVLTATGKIEELIKLRTETLRDKHTQEQAAIQQRNWEKSFGLQQQAAALAQTQAVAQNAAEQARLDLQRTAEARAAAQARAQNMQALTSAQTQRQAAYNQAATEYERFGVATPNRIQGLQDLKAPLPAAQAAGMLGLDVNSPEFKAVYDTYSMALAPGQGAQQPPQPAPVTPAPAPVPNPVTNSIPLISMPTMGNTPYLTQALGGLKTGYSPV